jgi:hypothetical protein
MKTTRSLSLIFCCLMAFTTLSFGQSVRSDKEDKEPSRIGYGINIGNIRFYNRTFEFGLAPNVAYRVSESFAVGFMLKADYYYAKYPAFDARFSAFDFGPTVFARVKPLWSWDGATQFLQGLFLQAEYERAFIKREELDQSGFPVIEDGKIQKVTVQQDYLYLGIGASSGYPFSTFFSLHYNILDDAQSLRFPFSYRIGFTYNY